MGTLHHSVGKGRLIDPVMGITSLLLMVILDLVTTAQGQNCSKPVLGGNMHLKGEGILLTTFSDGVSVNLACDVGHMSAGGSSTITCTAGTWSPVRMTCERKYCGSAGEVKNGNIDYSEGTQFGDTISIHCNTGFKMVGRPDIVCGDKGWMGRLPLCEVMTCDPPDPIAHGTFSPEKEDFYEYSQVVEFRCLNDYTLRGSKLLTCSEDGNFKPDPPACVKVECNDTRIENGDQDAGSRPPHRYQATMTFQCRPGYVMFGERTQICGIDSKWSPGVPECKLSATTKATTTSTTTTTTTTTTRSVKETDAPRPTDTAETGNNWLKWVIPILALRDALLTMRLQKMKREFRSRKRHGPVGRALMDGKMT
ncbi:putative membrane cofactor protein-like isoform 4 [Scophthalmus maximus]|uniref:Putative membrane cofactor protein-like isoform 4 n=1 Tax=Scophthalmus maximus TaxID=52904 RepID=A0A2U9C0M5_SCOMX|nr:putative membrane cofactor protein-like isoform 4 [Scophthalmus maximus]